MVQSYSAPFFFIYKMEKGPKVCTCGSTQNPNGYCDGSHNNQNG